MNAILAGTTGAVGRQLIYAWLNHPNSGRLQALVRQPIPLLKEEKLIQTPVNWNKPEEWPMLNPADIAFCCLGTTIQKAKTREAFRRVDYSYVLQFAEKAKIAGASTFVLVSAIGANANSPIFYSQVKGEVEIALEAMEFNSLIIAQPALLITPRSERRLGEQLAQLLAPFTDVLMRGPLQKYHSVPVAWLAKALVGEALKQPIVERVRRINYKDFLVYQGNKSQWSKKGQI